jgi:hypothetical protein
MGGDEERRMSGGIWRAGIWGSGSCKMLAKNLSCEDARSGFYINSMKMILRS